MSMIKIRRDQNGTAALEFAFAAPALLTMVIGVAQLGIMYSANNGVQHAVEEGARLAAVFPTPSDAQIRARVLATKFMTGDAVLNPTVVRDQTADGDQYVEVRLSYAVPLDFIFFEVAPVTVEHTRRVFCQVDSETGTCSTAGVIGTGGTGGGSGSGGGGNGNGNGGGNGGGTGTDGGTGGTGGGTGTDGGTSGTGAGNNGGGNNGGGNGGGNNGGGNNGLPNGNGRGGR